MPDDEFSLYVVELLQADREAIEKDLAENPAKAAPAADQLPKQ